MTGTIKDDYVGFKYQCRAKNYPMYKKILYMSKFSYKTFLLFLHCYYFNNCSVKILLIHININRKTIFIFKKIENIICRLYDKSIEKLGGERKVFEIDETFIAKREYNRDRKIGQIWVFGIEKRVSGKFHLKVIKDKT
ncbi:hypothetical protein DMUE_0793 [Dictyocoela muelleri]|nr:hypothetical protein DMUE_0793 [Dictyocoela muelleri]